MIESAVVLQRLGHCQFINLVQI